MPTFLTQKALLLTSLCRQEACMGAPMLAALCIRGVFTFWGLLCGRDLHDARDCRTQTSGCLRCLEDVVWNTYQVFHFKLGLLEKRSCISNVLLCQEQQKIQSHCSALRVSHMCYRTALLKPPPWLFSSVAGAVCLLRKDQLCCLNNSTPSAAAIAIAVCEAATQWRQACRHFISLSVTACVFPRTGARWGHHKCVL